MGLVVMGQIGIIVFLCKYRRVRGGVHLADERVSVTVGTGAGRIVVMRLGHDGHLAEAAVVQRRGFLAQLRSQILVGGLHAAAALSDLFRAG